MTAVHVPAIPAKVWLDYAGSTVHSPLGATVTDCGDVLQSTHGQYVDSAEVWRWKAGWCPMCWPGRRCHTETRNGRCGVPSGDHTECAVHLREAIDRDKALERAA